MIRWLPAAFVVVSIVVACTSGGGAGADAKLPSVGDAPDATVKMVAGSENRALEPIFARFARDHKITLAVDYLGSIDISDELSKGRQTAYDLALPANALWLDRADARSPDHVVKYRTYFMRTPNILGVAKSKAVELGWDKQAPRFDDVRRAAEAGKLKFAVTSATQSNSGANVFFAALQAAKRSQNVLTAADLDDPAIQGEVKSFYQTVERSSGSSGYLLDLYLSSCDFIQGVFVYESVINDINARIAGNRGKGDVNQCEELRAVYPADAIGFSDSPLAFIKKNDDPNDKLETLYKQLAEYLLSDPIQKEILNSGRRPFKLGAGVTARDLTNKQAFRADLGFDLTSDFTALVFPEAPVVEKGLVLYQTRLRKPSANVWVLDESGSMGEAAGRNTRETRDQQLKRAIRTVLDQDEASRHLLQMTPDDLTIVVVFDSTIRYSRVVRGSSPAELKGVLDDLARLGPGGGTAIYQGVQTGMSELRKAGYTGRLPAVILMTDGQNTTGSAADLDRYLSQNEGANIPVFAIQFGEADPQQLNALATSTRGRVFLATNLVTAVKEARSYN